MADKVIVAVHGVGDQFSYETIQAVARQFCRYAGATGAVPLGRYYSALKPDPSPSARPGYLDYTPPSDPSLSGYGFAEIYWANVPRPAIQDGRVIEETKKWAKTIVERMRAREKARNQPTNLWIKSKDLLKNPWRAFTPTPLALGKTEYRTIKEVLGEMIDTLAILQRLAGWLESYTRFRFPITRLLRNYVDDVQVVTEYRQLRHSILTEFNAVMEAIQVQNPGAEIYVIAHSEGTVISFFALLDALIDPGANKEDPAPWIANVKGFMTFGSPIDKHLILWPELWKKYDDGNGILYGTPHMQVVNWKNVNTITWCNYFDFGDPIGFSLDTARAWLSGIGCTAISLAPGDDIGFSRYPLPGKAHNDYWRDDSVFHHFIDRVGLQANPASSPTPASPPASSKLARFFSFAIPYAVVAAICGAGTYILFKSTVGVLKDAGVLEYYSAGELAWNVSTLALTLFLATASARIPRLARKGWSWLLAFILATGAACLPFLASDTFMSALSKKAYGPIIPSATAVTIAIMGWVSGVAFPRAGMIPMLVAGAAGVIAIMACILGGYQQSLLPVFSAGAVFLYLWWLSALVFDLSFVWHRYIRRNTGLERAAELMTGIRTSRNSKGSAHEQTDNARFKPRDADD